MASPPDLQQTIEKLSTTLEKSAKSRREQKREAREDRKAEKRQKEIDNASVPGGIFGLVMAIAMVGIAITHTQFWWLIFVALGVGSGGAKELALARERDRRQGLGPQQEKPQLESGPHEIDALCDQLLSDLKASPEVVRAFLQHPEQTVEALRVTAKAVDQRRKDLAGPGTREQLAALEKQRVELKSRRDGSSDVEARVKFDGALRSLDGQESALKMLVAVSDRLDGEYTSLLVLLQELKTRVAVARSTNTAGGQLEGLEQNVQRLNAELQAITESLVMTPVDEGAATNEPTLPLPAKAGRGSG
jgi:F0F1-type ATP synthase assembly protein I